MGSLPASAADKSVAAIERLKVEFGSQADVSFVIMDLAELASVRRAAAEVLDKVSTINALICNGAIAQIAKQEFTIDIAFADDFGFRV